MIDQTISHFKILEKLGEGGMGVVYKAQDTQLDRFVALKFLPSHVAASNDDKSRFLQEARAVASLAHPNICTIHSVEEQDGKAFIVLEYVEGKTLKDLDKSLPLKQAIEIGIQVADGLAAAHEKGIVHRDIKPDNIMLRKDGRVQIMDFGLAKLRGVSRLTKEGTTVGTAGYMSPEQIQGKEIDHRSDIFSLGVLLYELFAGRSPFKGIHETALSYEIVHSDVDPISSVNPDIDPALDGIVLDCLEKEPAERCQSAAEVARDLRRLKRETSRSRVSRVTTVRPLQKTAETDLAPRNKNREKMFAIAAGSFFVIAAALAFLHFREPSSDTRLLTASILPPERTVFSSLGGSHIALSPDGKNLAFAARDTSGRTMMWIRPLGSYFARPMPGTEGATYPFWSPDSRFIAFFSGGSLRKIEVSGGPPQVICAAPSGRGGSWGREGVIVFASNVNSPIYRVSAAGGASSPLIKIDTVRRETGYRWPHFLPDGRHFLYVGRLSAVIGSGDDRLYVGSIDSTEKSEFLFNSSSNAIYSGGHLMFLREQSLIAQPFDASRHEITGEPIPLAEKVQIDAAFGRGTFCTSDNGVLVYQTGAAQAGQLSWFDRGGKHLGTVGTPGVYYDLRLSPDNTRLAVSLYEPQLRNADIWIYDLRRDVPPTRFTFDPSSDRYPVWYPDGNSIVFGSQRKGPLDLYRKSTSGVGNEEVVFESNSTKIANTWTRDGKTLLFSAIDATSQYDLWSLSVTGERTVSRFLGTEFNEARASLSPDDKWVAYSSNESGTYQIYVSSFPVSRGKFQVSTTTGTRPRWRRDGREIFYLSDDDKLMAAEVRTNGSSFEVGNVRPLFTVNVIRLGFTNDAYDVTNDGQRFIMNALAGEQGALPVTLVVNWPGLIKDK